MKKARNTERESCKRDRVREIEKKINREMKNRE